MSYTPDDVERLTAPTDCELAASAGRSPAGSPTRSLARVLSKLSPAPPLRAAAFLCPLSANTHGIDFLSFCISDYETKRVIFKVGGDAPPPAMPANIDLTDENSYRKIRYDFSEDVLRLPTIATR